MLLPQTLLILPRVATRGGAAIAHVLDSKTSQPIRSAYPVGLTWVTLHASGSAAKRRVERALDTGGPTVQHVRVDLGRGHVSVPEQLLDGSDVAPVLEQVRCERVTQRVRRRPLGDSRSAHCILDATLEHGLV